MKAIVLTFDSLNRHYLEPYGCGFSHTPHFRRLAERTVRMENAYVGSMPCMPARRELHTGRYNFLHCGWGGLEPYDDSMPELLRKAGVYTHHCTDHYHYWEDGGHHMMQRYSSHEMFRGQEGDFWTPVPIPLEAPEMIPGRDPKARPHIHDEANRQRLQSESDWPMHQTVDAGLGFLEKHHADDNWMLHIETFDPHEPFVAPESFRQLYKHDYVTERADWPPYGRIDHYGLSKEQVCQARAEYLALLSFCDHQLGRVLDMMDAHNMWEDTLLIVHTDHGFFLGEKDLMAKCVIPFYNEVARTPMFIWDPRCKATGETRQSLVQMIDVPATLLEFFGVDRPEHMQGQPLRWVVENDAPVRKAALFGQHGKSVNLVTDDGLVYFRAPEQAEAHPSNAYTLGFAHMRGFFGPDVLRQMELVDGFNFAKGMPLARVPMGGWESEVGILSETLVFDLNKDPDQLHPFRDEAIEARLCQKMAELMQETEAPSELYQRLGIEEPA